MIEKLFDMTNFEQSLKDHADDFTIVPSRRVWQGIYNNVHPGRKWPSFPMAIMLLLSLMGIGYLNNAPVHPAQKDFSLNNENLSSSSNSIQNNSPKNKLRIATINKNYNAGANYTTGTLALQKVQTGGENSSEVKEFKSNVEKNGNNKISTNGEIPLRTRNLLDQASSNIITEALSPQKIENYPADLNKDAVTIIASKNESENDINDQKKANSDITKLLSKKKPRITFSYFVMPTVTNAYFVGNEENLKDQGSILKINPNLSQTNRILNAQLGLRLGGQIEYHLNPKFQLLLMGQIAYSGYTIISNNQPLTTGKLALKGKTGPVYSKAYFTNFGNGKGENQVPLKNYSLQVSIPVGVQYELWQNKGVGVFVNAAAGPTFVLKSNAHLLSSDGRNYVDDQSLMRKSNYTGYLGSHIEFTAKNMKWRVGPTVSYQLLSTYEDTYPVKEHLIDYGIKIGISK